MANTNFEQEIRARIQAFTEELARLVRESALESLKAALGESSSRPARGRRGRLPAPAKALPAPKSAGRGRRVARRKGAKRPPEELEQLTTQLLQHIKANPGQRIEQISGDLGVPTKELNLPAKKLLAGKQIRTKGQKRATQYFPK
jgi:hypothetical protein